MEIFKRKTSIAQETCQVCPLVQYEDEGKSVNRKDSVDAKKRGTISQSGEGSKRTNIYPIVLSCFMNP
jgi:hypothetical protein